MLILSAAVMLLLIFFAGIVAEKVLDCPFSYTNSIMLGFLSLISVQHVVSYGMMQLGTNFELLFHVVSALYLAIAAAAVYLLVRGGLARDIRQHSIQLIGSARAELPLLLLSIGAVALMLFISLRFAYVTSDDSYYLPRVMEILAQNQVDVSHGLAWSGIELTSFPAQADPSTLEIWKAYWSRLFSLNPAVFCRRPFIAVVVLVSCCALYQAYSSLSGRSENNLLPGLFVIVYLLLLLLDFRRIDTMPFWTVGYPSQGKSIICAVIYPAIIYGCARIVDCGKGHIPWQRWAMLSLIFTAGIASTVIGVFWAFLCCLMMGLPYLLLERFRDIPKLLPSLFLACLPVVVYGALTYIFIVTDQPRYLEFETPVWFEELCHGMNPYRLPLLIISMAAALFIGTRSVRLVVVGGCVMLFTTLLNPLFIGFVSKYLTTGNVYFRSFWMVPVYFLAAYVAAELFGRLPRKLRQGSMLGLLCAALLFCSIGLVKLGPRELYGRFYVWAGDRVGLGFICSPIENPLGIDDYWYDLGSELLEGSGEDERVRVMWMADSNCMLRQYSHRIELIGACRTDQIEFFDLPLADGAVSPLELWEEYSKDGAEDFEDIDRAYEQLLLSGIDYICLSPDSGFARRESLPQGFELVRTDDILSLYRIVK